MPPDAGIRGPGLGAPKPNGRPPADITWLDRDGAPGAALERALRAADLPPGDGRVFVAAEAAAVRRTRRHLLTERALAKEQVYTRGYWTAAG